MARTRDQERYQQSREQLLAVGQDLFINSSFNCVGLNDILKKAGIPKGSFYHYFESKEDFGLQVIEMYAKQNYEELKTIVSDNSLTPYEQLEKFFETNIAHFDDIDYCQGCLMANLSQELADVNEKLRCKINELSQLAVDQIAECIENMAANELNLNHLEPREAAQVLMNSWQGAIMKMKLEKSREPLNVFMKFFFSR
ncbi:MAG: TetR family transcriptional regulator [Pseudomonadales bacterium]|nr:TetR family transcriptional regulator [Pseudomonadales bacterium]